MNDPNHEPTETTHESAETATPPPSKRRFFGKKGGIHRLPLLITVCAMLGTVGSVVGLGGVLAWQEPVAEMPTIRLPDAPAGDEEAWQKLETVLEKVPETYEAVLKESRPAITALAGTNLVSSVALLFGALAARARRPWGARSLRTGLVLSQAYAVLALAVQAWVQYGLWTGHRGLFAPLAAEGGTASTLAFAMLVAQIGSVGVTLLLGLGQLGFYAWGLSLLGRPGAAEALAPEAS
ncbi:hypothetical protein [Vulgatibacter incomptus]|uniref:hypothetical protein n=1 Tax=Vulgatibacter incomptus TaxID=1391653 RepID=UPI0012F91ADB|nr:hypothetical protein [Vulgatibacter incomptus]